VDALTQMLVKTAAEQHARIRGKQKAAQAISLHKREGWDLTKEAVAGRGPLMLREKLGPRWRKKEGICPFEPPKKKVKKKPKKVKKAVIVKEAETPKKELMAIGRKVYTEKPDPSKYKPRSEAIKGGIAGGLMGGLGGLALTGLGKFKPKTKALMAALTALGGGGLLAAESHAASKHSRDLAKGDIKHWERFHGKGKKATIVKEASSATHDIGIGKMTSRRAQGGVKTSVQISPEFKAMMDNVLIKMITERARKAGPKKTKKAVIVKEARAFGTYLAQRDRRRILAMRDPDAAVSALHKTAAAGGLVKHASVDREELILRKIGEMFGR
jgi:hypothetical protein